MLNCISLFICIKFSVNLTGITHYFRICRKGISFFTLFYQTNHKFIAVPWFDKNFAVYLVY